MIGQYLSNTNEKATVSILQNILELNKASIGLVVASWGQRDGPHQTTDRNKFGIFFIEKRKFFFEIFDQPIKKNLCQPNVLSGIQVIGYFSKKYNTLNKSFRLIWALFSSEK